MSKENRSDYAGTIGRIADELETRRVPLILSTARHFSTTPAVVRRQLEDAVATEFRRDREQGPGAVGSARSRARNGDKVLRQLVEVVLASVEHADPQAWPQLVGDALRKMVTEGR